MELIIGRETSTAMSIGQRLHVVTSQKKEFFIGNEGSVPNTVSRQHCKLTVDDSGGMTLTNIKPTNITYVNGQEIYQKAISKGDRIELGSDRFALDLQAILDNIELPQTYDISHLKDIWEKYQDDLRKMAEEKEKEALFQRRGSIATTIGILLGVSAGIIPNCPSWARYIQFILMVIAALIAIKSFIRAKNNVGRVFITKAELDKKFQEEYVCPNPECRRFLGNIPYDVLIRQTKNCNMCKANYKV